MVHKFIPMPRTMKIQDAKATVDNEWKKVETIPAWQLDKVKSKKEVVLEAQRDKKKVHFAQLMALCHLKNAELEPKIQNYKGPRLLRIQNVQIFGYVFDGKNGPNLGQTLKMQWFLLSEICTDIHSLVSCGTDSSRKFCEKQSRVGNGLFFHRKQGLFLSVYAAVFEKKAGKKQNMAPLWKKLMKNVDVDEPTSFLDHGYFGLYST